LPHGQVVLGVLGFVRVGKLSCTGVEVAAELPCDSFEEGRCQSGSPAGLTFDGVAHFCSD
jgi:hypothetical protein